MNKPVDLPIDFNHEDSNTSPNPRFDSILDARLSRRGMLRGSLGAALTTALGVPLAACGGGDGEAAPAPGAGAETLLGFTAVAKSLADKATVPAGYTASVVFATGDPMFADVGPYKNDGTDTRFDRRAGDCHDGMEYFGLSATGTPDPMSNDRALLGINFEYITPQFLHAKGPSPLPRPAGETDIEVDAHGVGIVEVRKTNGRFGCVPSSSFNRRITALTEIEIAGPARGHALLVTKFSPNGTRTRGTLNNCGTGKTPWGTLLTGEENWAGYFYRGAGDAANRSARENVALARYGRNLANASAVAASRYGWETAGTEDKYQRWNITATGSAPAADYRNEINGQGYVTEIDPYNPASVIKKRSALGRMAHESAAFGKPVAGKPLAVYLGDDAQNEYVYKFVSAATWQAADATPADRIATGDKYLDRGKLYVAKFNSDGTGQWVELSMGNPAVAGYAAYAFADDADVLIHSRIAADAVGATKMDRPEWCGVHPVTGEVYFTMTNNSSRRLPPTGSQTAPDAANPRAYSDVRGGSVTQQGNVNGHIVRIKDADPAATTFQWDVYLFGAEAGASATLVNLSGLTADQDFSSPDGLVFSASTGICWIQTDDGAYTDVSNCMMLAALPGQVGDGGSLTLDYGTSSVTTRIGKKVTPATLKRFFVGPAGNEITGYCESPDGKTVFINVQHPGDDTPAAAIGEPAKYVSHWPGNEGYGAGGTSARPRSATVMITKNDGGRIGS